MPLHILLFGATGVAGGGVLKTCLASPWVHKVTSISRRPTGSQDPKLVEVSCAQFLDFSAIQAHFSGVDVCFYCLGISQSLAPDEQQYREITHDYAIAAAKALRAQSPEAAFHFISGNGTQAKSRWMWARVKAETEQDLSALGFSTLLCWRPAYIHPLKPRQKSSFAELLGRTLYPLLKSFASLTVPAADIGAAMLQAHTARRPSGAIENPEIRSLAAQYKASLTET